MTTVRNRSTMISATLAIAAALLASAGAAQAKGGGYAAITGIRVTGINTVSSGPTTVVRDHRGNRNGEGGVTVTYRPGRPCPVDACVHNGSNWPTPPRDHRGR